MNLKVSLPLCYNQAFLEEELEDDLLVDGPVAATTTTTASAPAATGGPPPPSGGPPPPMGGPSPPLSPTPARRDPDDVLLAFTNKFTLSSQTKNPRSGNTVRERKLKKTRQTILLLLTLRPTTRPTFRNNLPLRYLLKRKIKPKTARAAPKKMKNHLPPRLLPLRHHFLLLKRRRRNIRKLPKTNYSHLTVIQVVASSVLMVWLSFYQLPNM